LLVGASQSFEEIAQLLGRDRQRALERISILVGLNVCAADSLDQTLPCQNAGRRRVLAEVQPLHLANQDAVCLAHASETVVKVIVWLCRSQTPFANGEISP